MSAKYRIKGVIFDKDGTLLEFNATWDAAFGGLIATFADGDAELEQRLAEGLGFDLDARTIMSTSPFVSDSNVEFGDRLAVLIGRPRGDRQLLAEIERAIDEYSPLLPTGVSGAGEVLAELAARGVPMVLATNDSETRGREHMAALGWSGHFQGFYGYDSGHGEKPDPGMVLAAARGMGLDPREIVMVGDSRADLTASRAAGTITALTGGRTDLVADADIVLTRLLDLLDHLGDGTRS